MPDSIVQALANLINAIATAVPYVLGGAGGIGVYHFGIGKGAQIATNSVSVDAPAPKPPTSI